MKIKTSSMILFLLVIMSITMIFSANAQEQMNILDPNIPDSWFEEPKLASEVGLETFNQSPRLKRKVEEGELSPVKNRLPNDPPVIEPYEEIGDYGGTLETFGTSLGFGSSALQMFNSDGEHKGGRATPDGKKVVPHLWAGWESSEDAKVWTIYLREGMKFSDGHPFTADDFLFWWEHEALNEDLNPIPPEEWDPAILDVKKINDYEVEIHFDKSVPLLKNDFHRYFQRHYVPMNPAHYLKKFHIDFRDEEELLKEADEHGFESWERYYEYVQTVVDPERPMPHLFPFIIEERSTTHVVAKANPYYPFVDTEGNQLPYIDEVIAHVVSDPEAAVMKQISGEDMFAYRLAEIQNLPAYRKNEEMGDYRLLIYQGVRASDVALRFNLTHDDPELREVFQDKRFRQAVSLGIDREEINERVYYGLGTPKAILPHEESKYYISDDPLMTKYVERDLEKAKTLLDEVGMIDENGDGYRELPNGEKFNPQILYAETWGNETPVLELAVDHLKDIGLNFNLKMVENSLFWPRRASGDFDLDFDIVDNTTDLAFPLYHGRLAPTHYNTSRTNSGDILKWWDYWATNGREGRKPPQEVQELQDLGTTLRYSLDEEERIKAGREIVRKLAEQIWRIGIVGNVPRPVIVSNDLLNVPETGIWCDDTQRVQPFYPIQFFIKQ